MKLSDVDIKGLSNEDKVNIVYDCQNDLTSKADVAFLLGSDVNLCKERAYAAAKAYNEGRINKIIATGGVKRNGIMECEILKNFLLEKGVKEEDILLEKESTDTIENMIYSFPLMYKTFKLQVKTIMIITSRYHIRRSLFLARGIIPKYYNIVGYYPEIERDEKKYALTDKTYQSYLDVEIRCLKQLIFVRFIDDIEIKIK